MVNHERGWEDHFGGKNIPKWGWEGFGIGRKGLVKSFARAWIEVPQTREKREACEFHRKLG